ncbi:unnamed protein product [Cylindrotheca closterium]|uniref:DDE Tnp4 domain-containing protein n=1 Tax=Cylindrotheca closterium TaxID=2856 RepID=A0AAD2JP24_9STRA|nr:unnamed protein product [Cylindrotheca closterium]
MYSHKFNGPAWRYEIGYSIFGKDIVWVNGPFKAGESEITLFREAGLCNSLEPLECVECDSGYKGDVKLKNPSTGANRSEREQKSAVRARHKIVNGRLKQFAVLDQVFRHLSREQHGFCFKADVVITQLKFEFHGRLYNVVYHNH